MGRSNVRANVGMFASEIPPGRAPPAEMFSDAHARQAASGPATQNLHQNLGRIRRASTGRITRMTSQPKHRQPRPTASRQLQLLLIAGTALLSALGSAAAAEDDARKPAGEWVYLDNGEVRLGVKISSGAAIGYFSNSKSDRNFINHHDHGRLVQQSYYGREDGSKWAGKPWRWNPVQGGDYQGAAARVLELRVDKPEHKLYARTLPKHWATGADLPDVTMEQWMTLTGKVAHVRYKFTYSGKATHPEADQEIPAVFVDPALDTLVRYDGKEPWTRAELKHSRPGWPNEYHESTENWAAYVGADGAGVGAYVPVAKRITAYRYGDGHGPDACSYFAPLVRFAITPGFTFEYDLYLTTGTTPEIREAFDKIREARAAEANAPQPRTKSRSPMH